MAEKPPEDAAPAAGMIDEMQQVALMVQRATSETERTAGVLRGQLDEIARLSKTIRQLAQQTNLLALNATLEAARAGEAGRGFKVVSQEVKALANRASAAASEIDDRLSEAIGSAEANTRAVENLTQAVGEGIRVVGSIAGRG